MGRIGLCLMPGHPSGCFIRGHFVSRGKTVCIVTRGADPWEAPGRTCHSASPGGAAPSSLCGPGGRRGVQGSGAHLFQWQLPEQRQRAGEQPDEEGRGGAHDVNHGRGQHGDVGVLPAEGVDERHHGVAARGQRAAGGTDRQTGEAGSVWARAGLP